MDASGARGSALDASGAIGSALDASGAIGSALDASEASGSSLDSSGARGSTCDSISTSFSSGTWVVSGSEGEASRITASAGTTIVCGAFVTAGMSASVVSSVAAVVSDSRDSQNNA